MKLIINKEKVKKNQNNIIKVLMAGGNQPYNFSKYLIIFLLNKEINQFPLRKLVIVKSWHATIIKILYRKYLNNKSNIF
jgi:hypothetical protein